MSHQGPRGEGRPPGSAPQNTVFRRPCFQIALSGTGPGAHLGVHVVAAPPQHRRS